MPEELDVLYDVGPAREWSRPEKRVITSAVMAYLLEPAKFKRRRRIELTLLAAHLEELKGEARDIERFRASLVRLEKDVAMSAPVLARHRPASSYKSLLMFDLDQEHLKERRSPWIRYLLATGLIVHTMHDAFKRREAMGPSKAMAMVSSTYKSNPLFASHDKEVRTAWRNGRRVASLAAALLQFISDEKLNKVRVAEQWMLRVNIERFLGHARFFEQFLLREGKFSLKEKDRRLRYDREDFIRMPPSWGIEPIEPKGTLWLPEVFVKRPAAMAKAAPEVSAARPPAG